MERKIRSALISVYNKNGLLPIIAQLSKNNVTIYATGGTYQHIVQSGANCTAIEQVTGYPSILGGRVKTLHPKVFGGILARRDNEADMTDVTSYDLPLYDLIIVDLYPFEQTLKETTEENDILEKIDIGGVSLIRAAAKNFNDVCVISNTDQYPSLLTILESHEGNTSLEIRREFASEAFALCANYDVAIAHYFNPTLKGRYFQISANHKKPLRYGENPHQSACFFGEIEERFEQLSGKGLSYNNLVDIDAATRLADEFVSPMFAIVKHTNPCGIALRDDLETAWQDALAGDPESAFGGVLITNQLLTLPTAQKIHELFFEVLLAPDFSPEALQLLISKKNRIIIKSKGAKSNDVRFKKILNGVLLQDEDHTNYEKWEEMGARNTTEKEKKDLAFANLVCKHLKSNAIAIVNNQQLIGKGCGQTSRVDALRQAIQKAAQSGFDTKQSVLASDAFFPFSDCAELAHEAGITAIIQPGGSIRDKETIEYCKNNNMALVLTGTRHFLH
jgi:phosphoribosylaminoimidazolecarboxamide formyltransferase / IMP cyclohydrolase